MHAFGKYVNFVGTVDLSSAMLIISFDNFFGVADFILLRSEF